MYTEKPINHTLKNQHIRFVPAKRLDFSIETPDGKLALVYQGAEERKMKNWQVILGSAIVPTLMAPYMVPPEFLFYAYSALFLPSSYALLDRFMKNRRSKVEVDEIHIYENGEQLLLKTHDGVLHKVLINQNDSHRYMENKDGSLIFVI